MATWDAQYINDLPDSSFAVIEPGGKKDQDGKTTPRSLRHLPYRDKDGAVDLPHLRAALARLDQTQISETLKAKARRVLEAAAKAHGVGGQAAHELQENGGARLLLFPRGKWKHPEYGSMEFNDSFFLEIKTNFDKKVLGTTLPFIDIDHNHGAAAGWIHSISIEPDGLWADHVEWTELGKQMIESGQFRFFSPWWGQYKDPGSGVTYDRVLRGGGLTNVPFLKVLPPVELLEKVGGAYLLTEWVKVDAWDVPRLAAAIRAESTTRTSTMTEDPRVVLRDLSERRAIEKGVDLHEGLRQIKVEEPRLVERVGRLYGPLHLTEEEQALALQFVPLSKRRRLERLVAQRAAAENLSIAQAWRRVAAEEPDLHAAAQNEYR